jgi:hypothetical protein
MRTNSASAQHTPGLRCSVCKDYCVVMTVDAANTALALARTNKEQLAACEALAVAANAAAEALRVFIAEAARSAWCTTR